jgi:CheY-like chemotaxis protein
MLNPAHSAPPGAVQSAPLRGLVLLAQDGRDHPALLCAMLDGLGLEVLLAANGARAVELALGEDVDLILMDVRMPVMDGMRAIEVLRASGFAGPVLALSASLAADDVRRYLAAGFSHCVGKPVERDALAALLGQLLSAPARPALAELAGYAELYAVFAQRWPLQLAALAAHCAAAEWDALAALAHQVKGSAGSFGHAEAGRLAGQIEQCVRAGDPAAGAHALATLLALEGAAAVIA